MDILKEVESLKWKETGDKIMNNARTVGMTEIDLNLVEIFRYFGVTTKDKMDGPTVEKVNVIYNYIKGSDDVLGELRKIDSKLGNPVVLGEKLDKIYSYVYSLNLEKGFDEEKEIRDTKLKEEFSRRQKEKEEADAKRETQKRKEKKEAIVRQERIEKDKRRGKYLQTKKNRELEERIQSIKKAKQPKSPELPKVEI